MNQYQRMVAELSIPSGQADRLRSAVLSQKPRSRRPYRPRSLGRKALLAAILAAVLAAAVGAAEMTPWAAPLLERFGPDAADTPGADEVFQNVDASSVCGDVTLTVRQAVGDGGSLYLLLDYQLPESADLSAAELVAPPDITLYRGTSIRWEDLEGKTDAEVQTLLDGIWMNVRQPYAASTELLNVNPETRTIQVLYQAEFSAWTDLLGGTVSVVVRPPEAEQGGERIPLADHVAVVSFQTDFGGSSVTGGGQADGRGYQVELSPISLRIRLWGKNEEPLSSQELCAQTAVRFRDGTCRTAEELQPPGGDNGSSASTSGTEEEFHYRVVYTIHFDTLLDPSQVEAVLVGDTVIPVN